MIVLISIFAVVPILFYIFVKWKFSYWERRGVVQLEPEIPYGNTKELYKMTAHSCEVYQRFYERFKQNGLQFGGIYANLTPILIVTNMELIKSVLQTDFVHFSNHDNFIDEEVDPLTGHLFNLKDEKWRNTRAKLTPTFTTGKLKMMFQTMVQATSSLEGLLKKHADLKDPVDIKDLLTSFTVDIISSVAFGIESNAIGDPESRFKMITSKLFSPPKDTSSINFKGLFKMPSIFFNELIPDWGWKMLKVREMPQFLEDFFVNMVTEIVEYREKNNVYRKDFMHLLIQLKNMGKVTDDDTLTTSSTKNVHLTLNEITAHSFVFFIAGFETSSTAMTFALFYLAQDKNIQDKLRAEINSVLEKYNGEITYDCIMEMQYLEQVLLESLRMHAPVPIIQRECTKEYKIPNSEVIIEKGTKVYIPSYGVHRDPDYYPNPNKFDPERFKPGNKIPPLAFLGFGEGPRLCIGLRFGKLQAKVGLCSILRNFKVTMSEKTALPIQYENMLFFPNVKGGVWLNLEPIQKV